MRPRDAGETPFVVATEGADPSGVRSESVLGAPIVPEHAERVGLHALSASQEDEVVQDMTIESHLSPTPREGGPPTAAGRENNEI